MARPGPASALLTKGVSADDDATFAELKDAVLRIPQKLVIGVQEVPGTITYHYHYHADASGENPHTETSPVNRAGAIWFRSIMYIARMRAAI